MKKTIISIGCTLFAATLLNMNSLQAQDKSDSLVNVAFGQVAKEDLSGAISTVNVKALLEKSYSTNALDGLSTYVGGYTGNIWGQSALILVDGIPRDISSINATQVESVTVLKGASAVVLYGSQAAKGVVLITLKRGEVAPMKIDVRVNGGINIPKVYPHYLDAASYMTLYNEARRNDGMADLYSQSTIYNTATGVNPYRYPDIDFFSSDYLRKAAYKTDVTAEIHGGTERARYYTNFGMSYNNKLVKYGEQNKDNDFNFNVKANIDVDITDWLRASSDAGVILQDSYAGRGDFWGQSATLRPNWIQPLVPIDMFDPNNADMAATVQNSDHIIDGKYLLGGTNQTQTNNFSEMLAAGYIKNKTRQFLFNVNIAAQLDAILKGLSFNTKFSVDYTDYYNEAYKIDYATYEPKWSNVNGKDMIIGLTKYLEDKQSTNEYVGEARYTQTMLFSAQFDYVRTFNDAHNVTGKLMGWGYQKQNAADSNHNSSSYHRPANVNLGVQATYNYQHRYYADLAGAYVHSAKLPEGGRQAFSPSIALGWRISNEAFFKNNITFVDDLKITAAYTNLHQDLDISDYYMYKGYYKDDAGWWQWHDGTAGGWTTGSVRGQNDELTFVTREEFRIGLEGSVLNKAIVFDLNYFNQYTKGLLTQGAATIYPSFFKADNWSYLPYLNYNQDKRTGVDFSIKLNKKIGEVDATLGLAGMFYSSQAVVRDEIYQDTYQNRAGKPLDAYWGYICEGFFKDQAEIDAHATQTFGSVKPGDLKYKDVNGDHQIDSKDQVNLGKNGWAAAPFTMGMNLTLKWKNFTLYALATGNTGSTAFFNSGYYWIRGENKYSEVVLGRWQPDQSVEWNLANATYPRLTTTDNTNNFRESTFWEYDPSRIDLSRVQITYDFPSAMFDNKIVKSLSVYCAGQSLLTFSKEREHMERNVGSAPQNRFFNLGLKASF